MTTLLHPSSVLVDTNVWIAYLMGVPTKCEETSKAFEACALNNITLLYAPATLKDIFYIVPRQTKRDARAAGEDIENVSFVPLAWAAIRQVTEIAVAAPQALPECELAWMRRSKHADFEDNLVIASAETCHADYVITYDQRFIEHFPAACITPAQLLSHIS